MLKDRAVLRLRHSYSANCVSGGHRPRYGSLNQLGNAGKLMANVPILFLPFGTYLNYSFFWLICTIARPPVSRLSAPLPAAGLSKPKVRRATVSIFSTCAPALEWSQHPLTLGG